MEQCGLQSVEAEAFEGLVSLKYLKLTGGQLIHPPSLKYIQKTLIRLDLQYNRIAHINDTYFARCEKVEQIYLQGNLLSIPPNIDHITHSLVALSLSLNQLNGVFVYFTKSFPKLKSLYLSENQITSFCMEQRRLLPSLEFLDLGFNNISDLNIELALELGRRLLLGLASNPIRCQNMKQWWSRCDFVYNDKNRLLCDDVVEVISTGCVNNTGRFRKY